MTRATSKDSKSRILDAFHQLLAERRRPDLRVATKEEEAERRKNQQALETASGYTIDGIVKGLADLQLEFGSTVGSLCGRLEDEVAKLEELARAIDAEREHLEELRRIRVAADALYILTQEHQEKLRTLEQEAATEREALEKDQTEKRRQWQKEQQEFDTTVREQAALLAAQRQREEEIFRYELTRARTLDTDQFDEKKRRQELELQQTGQLKERQWSEREQTLRQNQAQFEQNRQRLEAFPRELEEEVKKARTEGIEEASRESKIKADLAEKEWQGLKQGYELKIQALEQTLQKQSDQVADITTQLQVATKQSRDLAMRAFETSGDARRRAE